MSRELSMKDPNDWLLIVRRADGSKACVNLWQAIESGILSAKAQPLEWDNVVDISADTEENREGLPDITYREHIPAMVDTTAAETAQAGGGVE